MPKYPQNKFINRIIDANINRAKEGLRVCEEITRFILNNRSLTSELKRLRHSLDLIFKRLPKDIILQERESTKDVGKNIYINELKRRDCCEIFFANIQRAKESVRVLEEFSKLINKNIAIEFKKIRYDIYAAEKRIAQKISTLRNHR
ncbi:MAG: thiamine-phosphate pyrophosphorylase [Candidatus Omnitrophica bacterium]|nr:thiamine-phosphate pyrophosphorylase [Candidatus Omnitrophota bacterium]